MNRVLVDSGIDWLGKIPKDWNHIKAKYLVSITTGRKDANESSENGQYPFFTCSMENKRINDYSFDTEALLVAGNGIVGYTRYYNGKFDAYQRTYVLNNFNEKVNPTYLKYYFNSLLSKKLEVDKVGSVIDFIKLGDLKNFIITLPILDEQLKIANYLNEKCSKIDEIIKDNTKEIELLNEYKKSLISKIVLTGIETVNCVNINYEWINKIPKKWTIANIKSIFSFRKGLSITKEKLTETGIKVINYGQIHSKINNGTTLINELYRYVPERYLEQYNSLAEYGDYIFADTSEDIEGCGNNIYIDQNDKILAGYHTIILHNNNKIKSKYFAYLFKTDEWRSQIRKSVYGVKLYSITQKILKNTSILIPPVDEQNKIVEYLDKQCSKLDEVIEYRKQIIEKLEEYKKSLIYECVTGKREV